MKLRALREEGVPTFLAVGVFSVYAAMLLDGQDAPDGLEILVGMLIAYYFTRKQNGQAARSAATEVIKMQKENGG